MNLFKGKKYEAKDFIDHIDMSKEISSHTYYGCTKCGAIFNSKTGFSLGSRSIFSRTSHRCKLCDIMGHSIEDLIEIGDCTRTILKKEFDDICIDSNLKETDFNLIGDYHQACYDEYHEEMKTVVSEFIETNTLRQRYRKFIDFLCELLGKEIDSRDLAGFILDLHTVDSISPIPAYAFNNCGIDSEERTRKTVFDFYVSCLSGYPVKPKLLDNIIDFSVKHCESFPALLPGSVVEYILFK